MMTAVRRSVIADACAAVMTAAMMAVMMVMMAVCMTACSDSPDAPVCGGDIMLRPVMDGTTHWQTSRADGDPIPGIIPQTIGVFSEIKTTNTEIFRNQLMYNPDGKAVLLDPAIDLHDWEEGVWPYNPVKTWIANKDYYFYCYAPYNPTYAEWVPGPECYTFHMHYIPPISATEYTIGKYYVEGSSETGRPTLTLTHITSRLRFLFAISEKYSELRNIRITSIKISDSGSGKNYWECEVKLDKYVPKGLTEAELQALLDDRELDITVKESDKKYTSDVPIELIAENESTDPKKPGQLLETKYKSYSSAYNLLGTISKTNLTVVYDVYDKADMLVRKDQTVTNSITLEDFGDLERGKCYDVKIMVSPKYLYVLSDNDVAPTALIEPVTP